MNHNEKCYQTGIYTDECDCYLCDHNCECSGSNLEEDDDD